MVKTFTFLNKSVKFRPSENQNKGEILKFPLRKVDIHFVPLATEPGISLILFNPVWTQMAVTSSTCYYIVTFLTQ